VNWTKADYVRLVKELNHHCIRYYLLNDPVISDAEYDNLYKQLRKIEEDHPDWISPDSPTQRVGFKVTSGKTIKHLYKMFSLDNIYSEEELNDFFAKVYKVVGGDIDYVVEPKIDGAAVSVVYEDGVLSYAASRGDGVEGEDITHNIKTIRDLPVSISEKNRIVLRGEVYLSKEQFNKINRERKNADEPLFANPRNAAAGTLKILDPAITAKRGLSIFIYSIEEGRRYDNHFDDLNWLKSIGFPINEHIFIGKDRDVKGYIDKIGVLRKYLAYDIDGAVVKVNKYEVRSILGETIKYPKWAIAYKYEAEQVTTVLKDVIFQVGRTGIVTPVAVLETVNISCSNLSRASLHYEDEIKRLGVKIGDTVFVEKSGEIIPKVIKVVPEFRTGEEKGIVFPSNCPSCGDKLVKIDAYWKCLNLDCPDRVKGSITHYASRDAMDIRGLGENNVERFYGLGLLRSIPDIYRLKYEDLVKLERFGELSADNLLKSIEESKTKEFYRFIYALGIDGVGIKMAQTLALHFKNIDSLMTASIDELKDIYGIGDEVGRSIFEFFREKRNIEMLQFLRKVGVNMMQKEIMEDRLSGFTFLITGTLSKPRKYYEDIIIKNGGKILSGVSKNLNFLIVGENPGSKLEKAKSLGIEVITEEEFFEKFGIRGD
jgi:DNA ligase (NAD+)